jgi:uncharacterized protein (DUF952 family)
VTHVSRIYHIATSADWDRARADGVYTTSSVGKTLAEEGFIHASQESQVTGVANKYYRGVTADLLVLVIDTDLVRAEVRYEDVPGAGLPFPHIYGPLNADAVVAARPLTPGPDGTFTFTYIHTRLSSLVDVPDPRKTLEVTGNSVCTRG